MRLRKGERERGKGGEIILSASSLKKCMLVMWDMITRVKMDYFLHESEHAQARYEDIFFDSSTHLSLTAVYIFGPSIGRVDGWGWWIGHKMFLMLCFFPHSNPLPPFPLSLSLSLSYAYPG